LEATGIEVKAYYLGDFADMNYSDAFVNVAWSYVGASSEPVVVAQLTGSE
jgi:hypothetical protein